MKLRTIRFDILLVLVSSMVIVFVGATAVGAQPPVPHPVEKGGTSFEDCLGCHRSGIGDAPPLLADHQFYDNEDCGPCHAAAGFGPPAIPHPEETEGSPFEDCVACHRAGVGVATLMPADHQAHENQDCRGCHVATGPAAPAGPHPEETEGTPFEDCVFCHREGLVGAPVMPDDHQAYTNAECTTCHGTTTPPSIPHLFERTCQDCHGAGAFGAPLLPADHQARETGCFDCHATAGLEAPAFPPLLEAQEDCLWCHQDFVPEGVTAIEDIERDHSGLTGDTCLSCHRPAPALKEGLPELACGVCHPNATTAEATHNREGNRVDCMQCHRAANHFPHDRAHTLTSDDVCLDCHSTSVRHLVTLGGTHQNAECATCHVVDAPLIRNSQTGVVEIARGETDERPAEPPDDPAFHIIEREVDCDRCHGDGSEIEAGSLAGPSGATLRVALWGVSGVIAVVVILAVALGLLSRRA